MTFESSFHKRNHYQWSIILILALLIIGLVLQFTVGSIPKAWFSFPYNIYTGLSFVLISTGLFWKFKNRELVNLLGGVPFALVVIIVLGILTIGLGSINLDHKILEMAAEKGVHPTEMPHEHNPYLIQLGLKNITATWYFAFVFLGLLINLWFATLKRAIVFQAKNITFLLNHFGLWLCLFAGVLGQGDVQKLKMTLQQDLPEWRGVDEQGNVLELPIALELKKFKMEIYPNKLFLINKKGEALPTSKPDGFLLEKAGTTHQFQQWKVTLLEYVENAVMVSDKAFAKNPMWGSTNAAKIIIEDTKTGKKRTEWISCGNFQFMPRVVKMDEEHTLVMAPPEAKKFESELLYYQKDSKDIKTASIFVNQPLALNGWKIYQTSYDEKLGRWSDISLVELVSDPWLPLVYLGIFILMLGTISFLIKNSKS